MKFLKPILQCCAQFYLALGAPYWLECGCCAGTESASSRMPHPPEEQ